MRVSSLAREQERLDFSTASIPVQAGRIQAAGFQESPDSTASRGSRDEQAVPRRAEQFQLFDLQGEGRGGEVDSGVGAFGKDQAGLVAEADVGNLVAGGDRGARLFIMADGAQGLRLAARSLGATFPQAEPGGDLERQGGLGTRLWEDFAADLELGRDLIDTGVSRVIFQGHPIRGGRAGGGPRQSQADCEANREPLPIRLDTHPCTWPFCDAPSGNWSGGNVVVAGSREIPVWAIL
jgi:hypothetical protein